MKLDSQGKKDSERPKTRAEVFLGSALGRVTVSPGGREWAVGGTYQEAGFTRSLSWFQGFPGAGLAPSELSPIEALGSGLCVPAAASDWPLGVGMRPLPEAVRDSVVS